METPNETITHTLTNLTNTYAPPPLKDDTGGPLPNPHPHPFLKWVGGKSQLLPLIRPLLPHSFSRYYEVCLGGGALFFNLRSSGFTGLAFLYDLNDELIRTYQAVKDNPDAVISEFQKHQARHCEDYFKQLRKLDPRNLTDPECAGRMVYLNKSGFNGLYRVNRQGQFNSSWGKRESVNLDQHNLMACSRALQGATLVQGDFGNVLTNARKDDLVYIDPPFPTDFKAYTTIGFPDDEQMRVHEVCLELDKRGVLFMQSNSDCQLIKTIYRDFHIEPVQARRNVNSRGDKRGNVGEVIITNY